MSNTASCVTFGRHRYHQNYEMEMWCRKNIGPGDWTYQSPATWTSMGDKVWVMHSMFGHTTFAFKEDKDATFFSLRWS
jgi:hypothetical protein